MASVKFEKNKFEKEIGKLTQSLQEKIALFGMTVESLDDKEVELDITPDRPDLLSYEGFKRSFLGYLGKKNPPKEYKIYPPEKDYEVIVGSSVKDVRPYTVCAIVKGIKLDDSRIKEIIDMQEKLHSTLGRRRKKLAIGIYPLNEINLPIHYKAIEPDKIKFMPLESNKEMNGLEILQRHPTGKEYAHLLAGKAKFPFFVDSKNEVLSMPPIINSEKTGRVNKKTRDVFVECSGFDYEILNKCLVLITSTLKEMKGKIYSMKVGGKITPDFTTKKIKVSRENANSLLGLNLTEKEFKSHLEKMGYTYDKDFVEIPPYRLDILHEVDVIEDIAISYGYDKFVPEIPKISTIGKESDEEIIKRSITEALVGLGLLEISNYHLTKKDDQFLKMGTPEGTEKGFVELLDSKTEYNILRKDLTHYLMKIFSENVDSEYPQKIFEIGKTFELKGNLEIVESEKLSIGMSPGNFTYIKQVLDYLSKRMEIEFTIKEQERNENYFIEGRSADIYLGDKKIGNIGEIHPKVLKNFKAKMPVSLLEINLEEIYKKFN